jgi:hypothetical protein
MGKYILGVRYFFEIKCTTALILFIHVGFLEYLKMTSIESGVTVPKGLFTLYMNVKIVMANIFWPPLYYILLCMYFMHYLIDLFHFIIIKNDINDNPCYFLTLLKFEKSLYLSCNVAIASKFMKSIFLNEFTNKPIIKMVKLVLEYFFLFDTVRI